MALTTRLMLRQGQTLAMTPQLLQAIKLLQLSHLELAGFIQEELDRNPLLERADENGLDGEPTAAPEEAFNGEGLNAENNENIDSLATGEEIWAPQTDAAWDEAAARFGGADELPTPATGVLAASTDPMGVAVGSWSGALTSASGEESSNIEAWIAAKISLPQHLADQLAIAVADPMDRLIGLALIEGVDENGYFRESLEEIAQRLSIETRRVESLLKILQTFEPAGVAARDLAECLAIQLRDRNRLDPAMQALLNNLPLLSRRDYAALRKVCGVDQDDLLEMVAEIRALEPRPGRIFGDQPIQPVLPDVLVTPGADGGWRVELNSEVLPRVLVNQQYAAEISAQSKDQASKAFVSNCLQTANWLTKSLEQRARTILKVGIEIVRQQDGFFVHGVAHLRPLNLKAVAEAIGMHESTVSRVTSNKYIATPRGLFEMKYFFTTAIHAENGGAAHSAEAVRHRIKQMIDQEGPHKILSDDAIVVALKASNIDIARRTVAKYRESLHIPSSVERRRAKAALLDAAE